MFKKLIECHKLVKLKMAVYPSRYTFFLLFCVVKNLEDELLNEAIDFKEINSFSSDSILDDSTATFYQLKIIQNVISKEKIIASVFL